MKPGEIEPTMLEIEECAASSARDAAEQPGAGVLVQRTHASAEELGVLTPLAGLARDRLTELADMAVIERAPAAAIR